MVRQTATQAVTNTGAGRDYLPDPGCLPATFQTDVETVAGAACRLAQVEVHVNRKSVTISRSAQQDIAGVEIPVSQFAGVMVQVAPADQNGTVSAKLVLKHQDAGLSPVLAETNRPEDLAAIWPAWSKALGLPMLVCDLGGKIKPIDAFSAKPATSPAPRRRLALLTGRRPRFLVRRKTGSAIASADVYRDEREIIART